MLGNQFDNISSKDSIYITEKNYACCEYNSI
jgi:hypothetical protein